MQEKKYGCHNREHFKTEVLVQDGWNYDGTTRVPVMKKIPFTMSTDCRYRHTELGRTDTRCDGCQWREPTPQALAA